MFQLIVAVISIALVAALAIASIFYGGDAFTRSSERAMVTTLINQAQQIAGANALYKTDNGTNAADVAVLVPDYLAAAPTGSRITDGEWEISGTDVRVPFAAGADVCLEVGKQLGFVDGVDADSYASSDDAANCDGNYFRFAL